MERHPPLPMTPFDEKITTKQLQALKLLLPYMPAAFQKMLAFYIKFTELQNTIRYFSHSSTLHNTQDNLMSFQLLEEIRPYIDSKDSDAFESILSILSMMEMMQTMSADSMPDFSNLGEMSDIMNVMNMFSMEPNNDFFQKGNNDNE